jgi:hypothetical protein
MVLGSIPSYTEIIVSIADMSLQQWKETLDVNLTGSFLFVREVRYIIGIEYTDLVVFKTVAYTYDRTFKRSTDGV